MYDMMYNIMELFSPEGLIDIHNKLSYVQIYGFISPKNLSMNQVSNCMIWIFMKFEWILWMFVWNQKQIMSITIIFIMFL